MQEALSWKMGAVFQVQHKWLFLTYKDSCGFKSEDQQDFAIMSQLQSANVLKHPCFKGSSIKESSRKHPDYQLPIHWSAGQTPSHLFCHALDATRVQQMEKVKGGNRIGNGKDHLFVQFCHWHAGWRSNFPSLCLYFPSYHLPMQLRPITWPSTTVTFTFRVAATKTVTGEHIQTLLREVHHLLTEPWCSFVPIPFPWNIYSSKYKPDTARGDWDTDCVYKIRYPCWTTPVNNWSGALPKIRPPSFWQSIVQRLRVPESVSRPLWFFAVWLTLNAVLWFLFGNVPASGFHYGPRKKNTVCISTRC